ncbi:FMN-dependent NADH-azoreductase [Phaeobacter sp. C3_T13_0]|uniref:FMN-dependent NADH-azoreductase n=1 Tax=Phaeobacter cretensis TaxID=3342641 RepID=UPI0039BD108C
MNILRIYSSAQTETAQSRRLTDRIIEGLHENGHAPVITTRDLDTPLPQIDGAWITANSTPEAERTDADHAALALSDSLIGEIEAADTLIIGLPVYNFSVPASLKLWIDLICRARRTFAYSEDGPKGLMTGKKAIVVFASGGTPFGSDIDFASGYIRHILGFIGISDVTFIAADRHFMDDTALSRADAEVDALVKSS